MAVMGQVVGSYGVSGWIKVFPYTENIDSLRTYPVWWLGQGNDEWREVCVIGCEVHGRVLIAFLAEYTDRTLALQLKGSYIAVPRSQLPILPESGEDGYYWSDLIGLEVVNLEGESLGRVIGLIETGANDVLQVQSPEAREKERLIPFVEPVIAQVDLKAGWIKVDWGAEY